MSTYTPSAVVLGNITLPADGENIDAADVNSPLQSVADGVLYERARISTETARALAAEAAILTPIADLTALAAVAAPADGAVKHVLGFGFYTFKTTATTGISPFRVAAADATTGGWLSSTAHETTRTIYVPCNRFKGMSSNGSAVAAVTPGLTVEFMLPTTQVLLESAGTFKANVSSTGSTAYGWTIPLDEFLVDGCTIASAVLAYTSTGVAATGARFGLVRTNRVGTPPTTTSLRSAGNFVSGTAGAAGDRTISFTADQNNVVDMSAYGYSAVIYDECGAGAGVNDAFHSVALSLSGIPSARR